MVFQTIYLFEVMVLCCMPTECSGAGLAAGRARHGKSISVFHPFIRGSVRHATVQLDTSQSFSIHWLDVIPLPDRERQGEGKEGKDEQWEREQ